MAKPSKEESFQAILDRVGLERDPFTDADVEGLFYAGGQRKQIREQLLHLSRYGSPVTLISGPLGIGKTFLCESLLTELDSEAIRTVFFEAQVGMDALEMLSRIAEGLNIVSEGLNHAGQIVNAIRVQAEAMQRATQSYLVVIDDAELLAEDCLRSIVDIFSEHEQEPVQIRLLLFGDSAMEAQLRDSVPGFVDSKHFFVIRLPAFDRAESAEYIAYRMQTAGMQHIKFGKSHIENIFKQSEGRPDDINRHARRVLEKSLSKVRKGKTRLPVWQWFVAGTAALVMISLAVVWQQHQMPDDESLLVAIDDAIEKQQTGVEEEDAPAAESVFDLAALDPLEDAAPEFVPESAPKQEAIEEVDTVAETPATDSSPSVDADPQASEAQPLAEAMVAPEAEERTADEWQASPEDQIRNDADMLIEAGEIVLAEEQAPAAVNVETSTERNNGFKETLEQQKTADLEVRREDWLLGLDPETYTLQLLGSRDEASVKAFIDKYEELKQWAYFKTRYKNRDWYVVISGEFGSREKAIDAIKGLPSSLQRQKPWVRSVRSVQQDILRYRSKG